MTFTKKCSIINIVGNRRKYDSITYTDYIYEQVDYSAGDSSDALEFLSIQEDVVFYELLPIGASLDGEVVVKTYGNDNTILAQKGCLVNRNIEQNKKISIRNNT